MRSLKALGFVFVFALSACTSAPKHESFNTTEFPAPVQERGIASDDAASEGAASEEVAWVDHPCADQSGAPFRKHKQFSLQNGTIFTRSSATAPAKPRNEKPRGGGDWASVQQFLDEAGITEGCGGATANNGGQTNKPPKQPRENGDNDGGGKEDFQLGDVSFTAPVNFDKELYYNAITNVRRHGDRKNIRRALRSFLANAHIQHPGRPDRLVTSCPETKEEGTVCVKQREFNYTGKKNNVRAILYGEPSLGDLRFNLEKKQWELFDYYCQRFMDFDDFRAVKTPDSQLPGPNKIVSANLMNCEHTWPQSKFPFPKGSRQFLQSKTDLHHIFPTDTKINGIRGNFDFAEVDPGSGQRMKCSDGVFGKAVPVEGYPGKSENHFQPPTAHKGNVARALMYFSVRYNAGMSPLQEYYLRKWHREDPADDREIARNEAIYKINGVRNPFIDQPNLADDIDRFCRQMEVPDQKPTDYDCQ